MAPQVLPTDAAIQDRWNRFSALYEQFFRLWSAPALQAIVSTLDLGRADSCLEVGCGPGQGLALLRSELPPGARLVAVDFAPEMVARAQPRAATADATVCVGDVQALANVAGDASFARVVLNLVLHIVPDPDRAIREAHRVLAAGGMFGASVWGAPSDSPLFTCVSRAIAKLRDDGVLPPAAENGPPTRSNFHMGHDDKKLRQRFADAGFVDVVSWHIPCVWPSACRDDPAGFGFADNWLGCVVNNVELTSTLLPAQKAALRAAVAATAADLRRAGKPVACDVVVVVGRKPAK